MTAIEPNSRLTSPSDMTSLTEQLKKKALNLGFVSVGISKPRMLRDLPYGPVREIKELVPPADDMPSVKSVIIMVFHVWDDIFHTSLDPPEWRGYGLHTPDEKIESYFFGSAIMRNMAWEIVSFLQARGFQSKISFNIPLKTTAIKCGLGSQGKNTLLVTPTHGPRVNLVSVLTEAELESDRPFESDQCGDCQLCVTACPTKALEPYKLKIEHCMTYSAESPDTDDVPEYVREMERRLICRPTVNTYIECSKCMDVCPIGRKRS